MSLALPSSPVKGKGNVLNPTMVGSKREVKVNDRQD
jgi:hypothetical protein